jgi:hypothetical protein
MSVRDGPAKEPHITGLATIGAHTDQGENHGFKQTSASRLTDVYALAERTMGRHSRTPRSRWKDVPSYSYAHRGASVQFYTSIPAAWGEPFGTINTKHLLPWRVGHLFPSL